MENKVTEVLDKVRDICDLKKLEFGCEIKTISGKAKLTRRWNDLRWSTDTGVVTWTENKKEIIGLPVHLEHLLLALGGDYVTDTFNSLIGMGYSIQKSVEDNLRSNPELTLFIHNLICK